MEYKPQELTAWALISQFETIKNCKITKPVWKKSFWSEFFLTKANSLEVVPDSPNDILDIKDINWEKYTLYRNDWFLYVANSTWVLHQWFMWQNEKAIVAKWWYDIRSTWLVSEVLNEEPVKDYSDVYSFWYIKIKVTATVEVWDYITFNYTNSSLQWISTEVHYIQNWYCYIRWTNFYWTLPEVWEWITIHKKLWDVFVTAEKNRLISVMEDGTDIVLYETKPDDEIIDIESYNWVIFVMTKNYLYFSKALANSNINIYPLDFFNNMSWWQRIISFGKHLVLFWKENQIISPVNSTDWNLWYVANGLNFNHKLFSKYSAMTEQGSLYLVQDDKQFVKVDIISVSNWEYDLQTTDAIPQSQWLLDELEWDVYINKHDKYIRIINPREDWTTTTYNYNSQYNHWDLTTYDKKVKYIWEDIYWDTLYQFSNWDMEQEISFSLWGDSLYYLKTCYFVKFILVAEELKVPDYELTVDMYIGWKKITSTSSLNNYPISNNINANIDIKNNSLSNEQFWNIWLYAEALPDDLWYIINPIVRINKSAELIIFTLRNKWSNTITYWWSVIWYKNWLPEVWASKYITKQT